MFIFKGPPALIRSPRPLVCVTERLVAKESSNSNATNQPNINTNAVVLDARQASSLEDLNWLYHTAQKYSDSNAFRKPGGRVVILRTNGSSSSSTSNIVGNRIEAATVSEALVGFAKSLAKENGSRGATVNLIRDSTTTNDDADDDDAVKGPLQWLLSSQSCYVTGQELVVTDLADKAQSTRKQHQTSTEINNSEGVIMVTGAAGAIGKATAEFLNSNHHQYYDNSIENNKHTTTGTKTKKKFLLIDHPSAEAKLKQLADDLVAASSSSDDTNSSSAPRTIVETLPLDVAQADAGDIVAETGIRLGGLERVIHAAGITRDKTLRKMNYESNWLPVLQVNLEATISMDQALLSSPGALWNTTPTTGSKDDNKDGSSSFSSSSASFVYISSTSGIAGNAGQTNYAASKSGLLGYAQAMSGVYPQHCFQVVSPGFIATEMTQKMPWFVRLVASRLNALGQSGQPEDVAAAIAFLSSREAIGLENGSNLRVCGLFMGGR